MRIVHTNDEYGVRMLMTLVGKVRRSALIVCL
jgi:hypothetical protein